MGWSLVLLGVVCTVFLSLSVPVISAGDDNFTIDISKKASASFGEAYHVFAAKCLYNNVAVTLNKAPVTGKLQAFDALVTSPGAASAAFTPKPTRAAGVTFSDNLIRAGYNLARIRSCFVRKTGAPAGLHDTIQKFIQSYLPLAHTRAMQLKQVAGAAARIAKARKAAPTSGVAVKVPTATEMVKPLPPYAQYVMLWTRISPDHETYRNTATEDMAALITEALRRGLIPVLMGQIDPALVLPAVGAGSSVGASDVIDLREMHDNKKFPSRVAPLFSGVNGYEAQLSFANQLITRVIKSRTAKGRAATTVRSMYGQIGCLSGGMDGGALLGMPTVQYAAELKIDRMKKWSSPPGALPPAYTPPATKSRGAVPTYRNIMIWSPPVARALAKARGQRGALVQKLIAAAQTAAAAANAKGGGMPEVERAVHAATVAVAVGQPEAVGQYRLSRADIKLAFDLLK